MELSDPHRRVSGFWYAIVVIFSTLALVLAILYIFLLKPFGFMLIENAYFYSFIALYVSLAFILFPATKTLSKEKIPWYDLLLFILCFGTSIYFSTMAFKIIGEGWDFVAPPIPTFLSVLLWLMVLEGLRRSTGLILAVTCGIFSIYPIFGDLFPGFLTGIQFSFLDTARYHAMSNSSILGIPMQVVGTLLVGFVLFGVALQITGGSKFFLDFAFALMGGAKGGPAKVSVISSALFGTMSGSVVSNVLVDGPFTIPAMVKAGYPPHYAAAIEAVTSTGGALMPPVMGTAAFVMASFLAIPYAKVILCATVPAILYYAGLFFQIDAYARRMNLQGIPKNELPSLWSTIKNGWFFFFALLALIVLIFYLNIEAQAPFYTMLILFLCAFLRKETRISGRGYIHFLYETGKLMAQVTAILAGIGLVIGSLSMTGVAYAFARELVMFAGENMYFMLMIGALASFILGMGMTATACYVFLAITLAPALVNSGLNAMAVHLFVLYWGLVSFITPPVAIGAITAASIINANPMKTGYAAMRLGASIYFVPFFFVLNPGLILIGSIDNIIISVTTAIMGIYLLSGGLEGYIFYLGRINKITRILFVISGILLAAPQRTSEAIAAGIFAVGLMYHFGTKDKKR